MLKSKLQVNNTIPFKLYFLSLDGHRKVQVCLSEIERQLMSIQFKFRLEGRIDEIQKEYDQWQKSVSVFESFVCNVS